MPRGRDLRVRDVRQPAAQHGAGPREDRPPPHRQGKGAQIIRGVQTLFASLEGKIT